MRVTLLGALHSNAVKFAVIGDCFSYTGCLEVVVEGVERGLLLSC